MRYHQSRGICKRAPSPFDYGPNTVTPQSFVERVLALDEQLSRARLLLPLCTTNVVVNENGRTLALSDLLSETRDEFDSLARAQLEILIQDAEH